MERPIMVEQGETLPPRPPDPESVIDAASFLDGRLHVGNHLRIEGEAKGEIQCEGTLTIAEGALVTAQVSAVNVVIAGTLMGDMICRHRLEILPTGRVAGTIITGSIIIQEGGIVEGTLHMRHSGHGQRSDGRDEPGRAGVSADPVQ